MKIIELQSENVKRLKAVRIKPDGSVVQIVGRNGAGKSSVLDSITMALTGGASIPEKPIREGEERAKVVVDLGDYKVTRTFTANDKTYLTVESKDGAKYPSPQALLDKLTGSLSFDPLAFARMEPKRQAETLRQMVGIDFTGIDQNRKALYEERQSVNRTIRDIEGRLRNMPEIEAPDEEVQIQELLTEHSKAMKIGAANKEKRRQLQTGIEIEKNLIFAFEEARRRLLEAENALVGHQRSMEALGKEVSSLVDPDIDEIEERIASAEVTNKLIRQKKERDKVHDELTAQCVIVERLTHGMQRFDDEKLSILSNAKFPVPGLSFDESGVTYNSIPFTQASSAEQLKISVAMGLALNPKIRVILIRDGSLLDADNMRIIGEMAEAADAQCWIERVATDEKVGIIISDGEVMD